MQILRQQLAARLCKGFDDPELQVRQALLTAQTPQEFFERLEVLRNGVVKSMRYDPNRLVNLNQGDRPQGLLVCYRLLKEAHL